MTTLHATNAYNVQATLAAWFAAQLAAFTAPPTIPTTTLILNIPETGLTPPVFSLNHLSVGNYDRWEGRNAGGLTGMDARAILDISAWVSRLSNPNWAQQLMIMSSMIQQIFTKTGVVVISDYSTPTAPVATTYKINLSDAIASPTPHDPNVDIERARYLVNYQWVIRSS